MQYHPKLKKAAVEINKILKDNDIAGIVVLHTPGFSEYITNLDPSYACTIVNNEGIRVRAKLQEDFNGDRQAWTKKVTDTVNMIRHIEETTARILYPIMELSEKLEKTLDIDDIGGTHTSHTTQNN